MAYRFLLAVLDKEGHASDKFEVIDFNYMNKFDTPCHEDELRWNSASSCRRCGTIA